MNIRTASRAVAGFVTLIALCSGWAMAADEVPQTTPEGMELLKQTKTRITYAMPGATLGQYTKVALLDCYVAFKKNWERDHNRSATFENQVHAEDMERIKADLADEFKKVFTKELTDAGHEIVDHTGEDVLVVRPALVNLDVTAPDLKSTGFSRVVVQSAGQMTLFMELYDSVTSAIIARIMDAEADNRTGFATGANRVTNKAAADRILRGWAQELATHLGEVKEESSGDAN